MEKLIVDGGSRLSGTVEVQGAKNSVLPVLAACVLCDGECVIHNCPKLRDVDKTVEILRYLGCGVKREGGTIAVNPSTADKCDIPENLMREMRSSVIFLGAILARAGKASMSLPGGCELGPRPIDLHLAALRDIGAEVDEGGGNISCTAGKMCGGIINLSFPSVGATENAMLAASACTGATKIINAAMEPEICDLQEFLNAAGVKVSGAGTSVIDIEGCPVRRSVDFTIMPDRIAAATYLCAAAAAGGEVAVEKCRPRHISTVIAALEEAGCEVSQHESGVFIKSDSRLRAIREIRTMPYPGFPTDAQAPLMAALTCSEGSTVFIETIFESRYRHVNELTRMGANIKTIGRVAVINGVEKLDGAKVYSTDLRGGAALVIAALCAQGTSEIHEIMHIDRGYENIEQKLTALGARIQRIK